MTEMKSLKSFGIYEMTVLKEANHERLAVCIKAAYRNRPQYKKVLDKEYAQCKELDHPNLLKYEQLTETDSLGPCIFMEWEDCRSLADYVAEGHSEEEKKSVVTQVADALSYLHSRGLIHAALTPAVIFVTTKGDTVKILNFRQRYADGLKQPIETLRFIAPEAKDGTVTLDARADVYSLGQLVKYLDMPASYQPVISGCCSFGRSERYGDIDTFLSVFNHQKRARAEFHEDESERATGSMANNRSALVIVSLIVALVIVAAIWIFRQQSQQTDNDTVQTSEQVDANSSNGTGSNGSKMDEAQPTTAPSPQDSTTQENKMSFLDELMPQVKTDLDNIYAKAKGKDSIKKKVSRYYKGLRKVLVGRGLNDAQLQAFDKAFADYNQQKMDEQPQLNASENN